MQKIRQKNIMFFKENKQHQILLQITYLVVKEKYLILTFRKFLKKFGL